MCSLNYPKAGNFKTEENGQIVVYFDEGAASITFVVEDKYNEVVASLKTGLKEKLRAMKSDGEAKEDTHNGMRHISESGRSEQPGRLMQRLGRGGAERHTQNAEPQRDGSVGGAITVCVTKPCATFGQTLIAFAYALAQAAVSMYSWKATILPSRIVKTWAKSLSNSRPVALTRH